jgi:hypothetical protein
MNARGQGKREKEWEGRSVRRGEGTTLNAMVNAGERGRW